MAAQTINSSMAKIMDTPIAEMEFLQTTRGSAKVCYNGYMYVMYRKCKDCVSWICTKKHSTKTFEKCFGQLKTDLDHTNPRTVNEHNHPQLPPEKILATKALQEMKRIAKESKADPQTILAQGIKDLDASILAYMPSKDSAKRSMRYLRTTTAKKKEKEMIIVRYVNGNVDNQALILAQQAANCEDPLDGVSNVPTDNYSILAERLANENDGSNGSGGAQFKVTNSKISEDQWEQVMKSIGANNIVLKESPLTYEETRQVNRVWDYLTDILNNIAPSCVKKNPKLWQKAFDEYKTQLMWTILHQDKWSDQDKKMYSVIMKAMEELNQGTQELNQGTQEDSGNSADYAAPAANEQGQENSTEHIVNVKCEVDDEYTDNYENSFEDAKKSDPNFFQMFGKSVHSTAPENNFSTAAVFPPEKSNTAVIEPAIDGPKIRRRKYISNVWSVSKAHVLEIRRRNRELEANTSAISAQTEALKELAQAMRIVAESNLKLAASNMKK